MKTTMMNTKSYKTGNDFFSRHDLLFHFLGGCLLSLPVTGFFKILDNILAWLA